MLVLKVENLGKKYIISHETTERYQALRDVFAKRVRLAASKAKSLFNGQIVLNGEMEEFWALRNINFDVQQGEKIGIIGRNGAGKSTLLKLLSRISEPSEGKISIRGRVASLLEVGTGFHPELTGRENIFLNGSILGMSKAEIKKKFDEIVDFSGVEKFLDTPVKRYSSGMQVRLGFAVAAHLEPEILVVDEVLAVGDAEFQKKCLGKMQEVSKEGRTILFVSHNMAAVQGLCNKCIWLSKGKIEEIGIPEKIVQNYLASSFKGNHTIVWTESLPGNEYIKLTSAKVLCKESMSPGIINMESEFQINFSFLNKGILDNDLNVGIQVINEQGIVTFGGSIGEYQNLKDYILDIEYFLSCTIPGQLLNSGTYNVNLLFFRKKALFYFHENALRFEIVDINRTNNFFGKKVGVFRPKLKWEISTQELISN